MAVTGGEVITDTLDIKEAAVFQIGIGGLVHGDEHLDSPVFYNAMITTETLMLAGTLEILFLDGFTASEGDAFDILDWGTLIGTFDEVRLPELSSGLGWDLRNLYVDGTLSVASDIDNDGIVDDVEDANQNGIVDTGETDPNNPDSDSDGIIDGYEVDKGFDPLTNDALEDFDNDGYSNLREYLSDSDPWEETDIPSMIADTDAENDVDGADLNALAIEYGRTDCSPSDPCAFDLNGDGDVDELDLRFFTEDYGRTE